MVSDVEWDNNMAEQKHINRAWTEFLSLVKHAKYLRITVILCRLDNDELFGSIEYM